MIDVRALSMRGVMSHVGTDVELPERGVVLVTGANGAGKSTIIEAVSVALWGHTLRGTKPWNGDKSHVEVVANTPHALYATRSCKAGKVSLEWGFDGSAPVAYETTTKAQYALEAAVGPWEVWRRTSVFSSQDAAHFSLATDAERKRLIESILQLERFDVALSLARRDAKVTEQSLGMASRELAGLTARYQAQREERARLSTDLLYADDPRGLDDGTAHRRREAAAYQVLYEATIADLNHVQNQISELSNQLGASQAMLDASRAKLEVSLHNACPSCAQPIGDHLRQTINDEVRAAIETHTTQKHRLRAELAVLRAQLDELAAERNQFASAVRNEEQELARLLEQQQRFKLQLQRAQELEAVTHNTFQAITATTLQRDALEHDAAVLDAVGQVLGLKGVRATVLGGALAGIESVANHWLGRVAGPGLRLTLRPYTERRGGGVSEAIDLQIVGAGGGHGYRAASGGERRRIDVALLLALAEVASAAVGKRPGTLWFDEVFDALDVDGVQAVVSVLEELAADRAVVVISHSETFTSHLTPAARWVVADGQVRTA